MAILVVLIGFILLLTIMGIKFDQDETKRKEKEQEERLQKEAYVAPQFKPLTQEQIDEIHEKGKLTQAEKVKEWESYGLCAPGDNIGSAAWRCRKFKNCHDCLVDYANGCEEHSSILDDLKIVNPH